MAMKRCWIPTPSPPEGFSPVRKWEYDEITMTLRNMAEIFDVLEKRGLQ